MKNIFLKTALALAVIAASPSLVNAQTPADWNLAGNVVVTAPVYNYLGTRNNAPLRIATNAGAGYTDIADRRMIVMPSGDVGIGQGDGVTAPTDPMNKLLIENGTIYTGGIGNIYQRLLSLSSTFYSEAEFGLISASNNSDANNIAIVGYSQNATAPENIGVLAVSLDGPGNSGLVAAGMNGAGNLGVRAAAVIQSGVTMPNSQNRAIVASVEADQDADNTGVEVNVDGDNADYNRGLDIDLAGDNAIDNEGIILNLDGSNVTNNNIGANFSITGSANANKGSVINLSANATVNNVGSDIYVTGTASNNNYGSDISVTGSAINNTGTEISVSGASNQNIGEHVTVTGSGSFNLGLDIEVANTSSGATGLSAFVDGGAGGASILGAGLYVNANGSQWSKGIDGFATGATSGNAGGLFSANAAGTNAFAIGVQGEVLSGGNYLNYGVYGDYAVTGNNGADYAGFFNGSVYTSALYYSSDPKLKENVRDYKGALEQLNKLDIKNYTYKKEYAAMNLPEGVQIGVMANNLREVFPNLVKKAIYPGSIRDKQDVTFDAVNTNALVPVLVQAVKELDAKTAINEKLNDEVAVLKADNESLKKDMADMKDMLDKICSNGCGDFKPASTLGGTTGSESNLFQNVPNPFSNTTVIPYTIGQGVRQAVLVITDLNGTELKRYSTAQAGTGTFEINMGDLGTGTYIYSLFTDGKLIDTKKMVLAGK